MSTMSAMKKSLPENAALSLKDQQTFQKLVSKKRKQHAGREPPGVVYVGHIPRGFKEKQMRQYFTQFGNVSKIRLARSIKTGGYKGYGYIEFQSSTVAKVVADTMNNYLMFHKLLKCQYLPPEKVHENMFKGWNKRFRFGLARDANRKKQNKEKTVEQQKKNFRKFWKKTNKTVSELKSMGIHFEFTNFVNLIPGITVKEDSDTGIGSEVSSSPTASLSTSAVKPSSLQNPSRPAAVEPKGVEKASSTSAGKEKKISQTESKKNQTMKRKASADIVDQKKGKKKRSEKENKQEGKHGYSFVIGQKSKAKQTSRKPQKMRNIAQTVTKEKKTLKRKAHSSSSGNVTKQNKSTQKGKGRNLACKRSKKR